MNADTGNCQATWISCPIVNTEKNFTTNAASLEFMQLVSTNRSIYVRDHLSPEAVPLAYKALRYLTACCDRAISSCRHLQPRNLVPGQHCPRAGELDLGAACRCPGPSAIYQRSSQIASVRSLLSLRSSRRRADPLLWRMHRRRRALPLACPDRQ